jgi:thymidylate synthase/dihydrofolate reductase
MTQVIVAMNEKGGIGYKNCLPWECKQDLALFKQKTIGKTIVVGRKTAQYLPKLPERKIICITRSNTLDITAWNNDVSLSYNLEDLVMSDDIIIAGGSQIYATAFQHPSLVKKVYLSIIKGDHKCDSYFKLEWLDNFVIVEKTEFDDFSHYILLRTSNGERQYLKILKEIMMSGDKRTGRNGETISMFKNDMKFDLRNGFPLLTTKKMFLRGILEEFLFFLRGNTDSSVLSEKGVHIWEQNTSKEFILSLGLPYSKGVMGPMYGYQWRFFNSPYKIDEDGYPIIVKEGGIDQLADVVNLIKSEPNSRRILMTSYNPEQAKMGVLYPCHSITIQFYVQDNFLDMFCYNRSQDAFLGVPFNIASSSLLLMVVAKLTCKIPRFFYMTMGDSHIYSKHIEQVTTQLNRIPYAFPTLLIPEISTIDDIEKLNSKDFIFSNYEYHPSIHAEMVA